MQTQRNKILVLAGENSANSAAIYALKAVGDVTETRTIDEAIDVLRRDTYDAIFSDAGDFLPLERTLVSQQASLILNTIGEGVCIVDSEGRCNWMNRKMRAWPPRVHETIRRSCQEAFELFHKQMGPVSVEAQAAGSRAKRYALNIEDQQFLEMIASPVISPSGQVVQVAAVVWDATGTRRLQQKIDAIDKAGRELVRLDAELLSKMDAGQRITLLQDKIIRYTRELMHFDHFGIRLLDRKTGKLEVVISEGLPAEALEIELYARPESNGISGYVAATGRSYICPDVERDPRYVPGLDLAKSTLTVPLRLHDKVIGVFNIESRQRAAFTEDDRQFAEIFGLYVAIALNILDLMVVERVSTSHKVADNVCTEAAGPLNDISSEIQALIEEHIGDNNLCDRLRQILDNAASIRQCLNQAVEGPNTVLGATDVKAERDAIIGGHRILVADDDGNFRHVLRDILRKWGAEVTLASNGQEAIDLLENEEFDLILSDIRMPDRSGYDVFTAARRKSATVPVILMTGFGYDPHHSIVRASQEGLRAVIYKPFKVQQFLGHVRNALAPAQNRA